METLSSEGTDGPSRTVFLGWLVVANNGWMSRVEKVQTTKEGGLEKLSKEEDAEGSGSSKETGHLRGPLHAALASARIEGQISVASSSWGQDQMS